MANGATIENCQNINTTVVGMQYVGGISGYLGSKGANPTGKEDKCYNKGKVINTANLVSTGGVISSMAEDANVTNCYYLSSIGINQGVGTISGSGDLALQNSRATSTNVNLTTFEEFLTWIENQ